MDDRTAPFQQIPVTSLGNITHSTGRVITHSVVLPGLVKQGGGPVAVDVTYDVHEIDHDWVSVIVDYAYDCDPTVYGNHPLAVGPLRDLLPDAYPLLDYPRSRRAARDKVVSMLAHHDLGGWVLTSSEWSQRNIDIHFPNRIITEAQRQEYFAHIREYFPFEAQIWLSNEENVIRVKPKRKEADG